VPRGTPWSDHFDSKTRIWFQRTQKIIAPMGDVGRAVVAAARDNSFHPVRQYFDGLTWDGSARLDAWLVTYFHAENSEYVRAIGPRYLISGAARVYEPGCKVDHVLVFEGPQGKFKSEALRVLAIRNEWFTDRLSNLNGKDAAQELAGVLVVEIGEMDALTRTSSSTAKAFLSRTHDRIRLPWGRHVTCRPRQNVFAATINPSACGYLRDPTGDRRFWPAACRGTIDLEDLKQDCDQLWAEAVHRYKAGAKWWLPPELEELAALEQRARFKADAWEGPIIAWLANQSDASLHEVLEHALGIPLEQHTQPAQNRVAAILTRHGFSSYRPNKVDGDRRRRYQRDPTAKKAHEYDPAHPDQVDHNPEEN
jgi:putative DNA primase/helicase